MQLVKGLQRLPVRSCWELRYGIWSAHDEPALVRVGLCEFGSFSLPFLSSADRT